MIVLRTPKGWTGPKVVNGKPIEGTFRAHQLPMSDMDKPEHVALLEQCAGEAAVGVGLSHPALAFGSEFG